MDKTNDNKSDTNNLKKEIFKNNRFSEAELNKYIKTITKDDNINEDMISILSEENCNEYNLDLIKLSEKKLEAKHNYDSLNGLLFSMILFVGSFLLDLFSENSSSLSKLKILMVAEILLIIILSINFINSYRKLEEKRAEAYFWLESEMEKRIRELKKKNKKDKNKDKNKNKNKNKKKDKKKDKKKSKKHWQSVDKICYFDRIKKRSLIMSKSANLNIRMKPEVKDGAENILKKLGIPPSSAIDMFYRQIIMNKGLPFEVKLTNESLVDISEISTEELNNLLDEGFESIEKGQYESIDDAFKSIYDEIENYS